MLVSSLCLGCVYLDTIKSLPLLAESVSALVSRSHIARNKNTPSQHFSHKSETARRAMQRCLLYPGPHTVYFYPQAFQFYSLQVLRLRKNSDNFFRKCAAPGPCPELLYKAYLLLFTHAPKCLLNCPLVSKQDGACSAGARFQIESLQNMTAPLMLLLDIHYH